MSESVQKVDIEAIIASKTNRKFPKFLVNLLKKIAHQDELNESIDLAEHKSGILFCTEALKYLDITYELRGQENLPANGKFIFAANHPLGGPEALILGDVLHNFYGDKIRIPVNNLLAHFDPLKELFIPVNTFSSKQERDLGEKMNDMFNSDNQVLLFPAGKCARKIKGEVTEMPWKKMFVTRARLSQRDVIPVFFSGHNSKFFFFMSDLSNFLGLKVNLAMLFLVDELFKKKHHKFTIIFGNPIPWQTFDKSKTDNDWAAHVRKISCDLGHQLQAQK